MSRRVDALRALADDHGFADFRAEAQILGGWALAESGEPERGLAELEHGLELRRAAGTQHLVPYLLGVAARVDELAGSPDAALERLTRAIALAEATGERWYEPELRRGRALLLRARGVEVETTAEASLALSLARAQSSRTFEARAAALVHDLGATPPGPSTPP